MKCLPYWSQLLNMQFKTQKKNPSFILCRICWVKLSRIYMNGHQRWMAALVQNTAWGLRSGILCTFQNPQVLFNWWNNWKHLWILMVSLTHIKFSLITKMLTPAIAVCKSTWWGKLTLFISAKTLMQAYTQQTDWPPTMNTPPLRPCHFCQTLPNLYNYYSIFNTTFLCLEQKAVNAYQ